VIIVSGSPPDTGFGPTLLQRLHRTQAPGRAVGLPGAGGRGKGCNSAQGSQSSRHQSRGGRQAAGSVYGDDDFVERVVDQRSVITCRGMLADEQARWGSAGGGSGTDVRTARFEDGHSASTRLFFDGRLCRSLTVGLVKGPNVHRPKHRVTRQSTAGGQVRIGRRHTPRTLLCEGRRPMLNRGWVDFPSPGLRGWWGTAFAFRGGSSL